MRYAILFILLSLASAADAQVYKWTDAQGNTHYGDIPPPQAQNVQQKKTNANIIETDAQPFETKQAAQKNPVLLYAFDGCDSCTKAREMLDKRGIPYTLKNTDKDKTELRALTGDNVIPVIVVGSQTPRQGFEAGAWNSMLDQAGYPKSNPLAALRKPADGSRASKAAPANPAKPR
jgi:glutaredoxin